MLELIRDYSFNISYMSSQSGDDKYQYFKKCIFQPSLVEHPKNAQQVSDNDTCHKTDARCPIVI